MFGSSSGMAAWYANTGMDALGAMYGPMPLAFFDIPDPAGVARTIERAAIAPHPTPADPGA